MSGLEIAGIGSVLEQNGQGIAILDFDADGWMEEHEGYVRLTEPVEVEFTPCDRVTITEQQVKVLSCPHCEKEFKTENGMKIHISKSHPEILTTESDDEAGDGSDI